MESELSYNTRVYPKDAEYTECEHCSGKGYTYTGQYVEDYAPETEMCFYCHGEGQIEITE